jgi:pimeloyl-ACP methyl ester carboxylesterase
MLLILSWLFLSISPVQAAQHLDVHYGKHERQIFDLWTPSSGEKAPLIVYIHGGGWQAGSKDEMRKAPGTRARALNAGFAFAAINYRFLKHAPLQTIMREDIGGFIQYIRRHSEKYGIDKTRIYAYGYSAGGSASLWLASHDDLGTPSSKRRLRRKESSRVQGAGHLNAQVSYDFYVWYRIFGKDRTDRFMKDQVYSRYHFKSASELETERGIEVRKELDMYGQLTPDDAPMLFWNNLDDDLDRDHNHFVHSPRHTRELSLRATELGIPNRTEIRADGVATPNGHKSAFEFFKELSIQQKRGATGAELR